jgi:hypothetical protein
MTMLKGLAALVVLIAANAFLFGGVVWNRSGEPTGQLTLDQCAFHAATGWYRRTTPLRYLHLNAVSATLTGPESTKVRNTTGWRRQQQRRYVVLKQGGLEWDDYVARQTNRFPHLTPPEGKLILVDGDTDAEALLAKYPDRTGRAIMAGSFWPGPEGRWRMANSTITVESRYRPVVEEITDLHMAEVEAARKKAQAAGESFRLPPCTPSHRITITWGRRFEPWISDIEPL